MSAPTNAKLSFCNGAPADSISPRFRRMRKAIGPKVGFLRMNDLIIPPEPRQPTKKASQPNLPMEIVIDRRGGRRLRYGLIVAFVGLAAVAGARFYASDHSKETTAQKTTEAPKRATTAMLDEATKHRIATLQDEVRELRTKLDAVEKRQEAEKVSPQAVAAQPPVVESKPAPSATQAAVGQPSSEKAETKIPRANKSESAKVGVTPGETVPPTSKVVSGYRVRDVYHGAALVEYGDGMIGVEPGEVVPGAGRVIAIRERAGRWVVVTEKGEILGDARAGSYAEPPPRRRFGRELFGFIPRAFAPPFFAPY